MSIKGRNKKSPKLYFVEWKDPTSTHNGWFELSESEIDKLLPAEVKSVGWVIRENKDFIVLASSLIEKDNCGSGDTTILRGLITNMVEIKL